MKQLTLHSFYPSKRPHSEIEDPESSPQKKCKPKFFDQKTDVGVTKHKVLSNYLGAWFAIHSKNPFRTAGKYETCPQYSRIVYVDGFAGPGVYSNGKDPGSPAVAYELAVNHKSLKADVGIYMIFIEKNLTLCRDLFKTLKNLEKEHKSARNAAIVKFMVINAEFVEAMEWILSEKFTFPLYSSSKTFTVPRSAQLFWPHEEISSLFVTNQTPFFVFVDPFGYNGEKMPMTLMQRILSSSQRAEVLCNLMTGFIKRFNTIGDRERIINLLIGNDEYNSSWKAVVSTESNAHDKIKAFLDLYYQTISEVVSGDVLPALFEMKDKGNRLLYHLFHVSRHNKGFIEMKKAMRPNSQSDYAFKYSSFRANQPQFKRQCVDIGKLEQNIIKHFSGEEFKDCYIRGRQISNFIDSDSHLYQRYRSELKKSMKKYLVDKEANIYNEKFDDLFFKFLDSQKPSLLYHILKKLL